MEVAFSIRIRYRTSVAPEGEWVMRKFACLTVLLSSLGGCGTLPEAGPGSLAIDGRGSSQADELANYVVIPLNENSVRVVRSANASALSGSFGTKRPAPRQTFGVGDVVQVSVFESAPGGLFSPPATSITTGSRQQVIPNQVVGADGRIDVPYAGSVRIEGRTPSEAARLIEKALVSRAIEPQVVVSLVENAANTASVLGDVSGTGKVKLSFAGDRLLSVLAQVGGTHGAERDTMIRLVRGNTVETVPLQTIVNSPSENVYVFPGDTIYVVRQTRYFNAFGAVGVPGRYEIDAPDLTLADAIGKAGGLSDLRADNSGLYLFRYEKPSVVRELTGAEPRKLVDGMGVPVVYRIAFSDPNSLLWLQQLRVRDNDVFYASNAIAIELTKFIALLDTGSSVALKAVQARRQLMVPIR